MYYFDCIISVSFIMSHKQRHLKVSQAEHKAGYEPGPTFWIHLFKLLLNNKLAEL